MPPKKRYHQPREQLMIAGTERLDRVPEIDKVAELWMESDEQIKAFNEEKKAAAEQLVTELQQRGLERYVFQDRYGQLHAVTVGELTVKVKMQKLVKRRRVEDDGTTEGGN
jgi:cell division septation protein DedD